MRADFVDDYTRSVEAGELKGQKEKIDFQAASAPSSLRRRLFFGV